MVEIPTDPPTHRMDETALGAGLLEAARRGRRVLGVVASACSTSAGAIDRLDQFADFCRDHRLWLHVDGAHGASLCVSPRERHKLAGIERADSVVWDAHKTLLCPSLVTGVLFRNGAHADASFSPKAEYLFIAEDTEIADLDLGRRTLECTKPAFALKVYATLATLGEAAIARYLEQVVDLVADFADLLAAAADFELAHRPEANIVCFRHAPEGADDLDLVQGRARARVLRSERFYLTRTTLAGRVWLRCTVLNPATTLDDLRALLDSSSFVRLTQDNSVFGMQAIDAIRTQYGPLRIVESLWCPTSKAYMLDSSMIGLYTLRPFGWRPMGVVGDSDQAELIGELSFAVANDKDHGFISGITT